MSLYNYFLTNPFGPGVRTLEWIYLNRTGGTVTDLDSEPTVGAATDGTQCRLVALYNNTAEIWQLIASDHIDDPENGWVRPLDYGTGLNEKVWKRLFCFSTGGGGGSFALVTNETPFGTINGTNRVFQTAQSFVSPNLAVYLNGVRQRINQDFAITTSISFTMTNAPLVGDTLNVDYTPQ